MVRDLRDEWVLEYITLKPWSWPGAQEAGVEARAQGLGWNEGLCERDFRGGSAVAVDMPRQGSCIYLVIRDKGIL